MTAMTPNSGIVRISRWWSLVLLMQASTFAARAKRGEPRTYRVKFKDGLERGVFEDELYTSPDFWAEEGKPPPPDEIARARRGEAIISRTRRGMVAALFAKRGYSVLRWVSDTVTDQRVEARDENSGRVSIFEFRGTRWVLHLRK
jgi:hypothetical protein